ATIPGNHWKRVGVGASGQVAETLAVWTNRIHLRIRDRSSSPNRARKPSNTSDGDKGGRHNISAHGLLIGARESSRDTQAAIGNANRGSGSVAAQRWTATRSSSASTISGRAAPRE